MSLSLACRNRAVGCLLSLSPQPQRLSRVEMLILDGRQGRAVLIDIVQEPVVPGEEAALIQSVVAEALEVISILRYLLEEGLRVW